LLIWRGFPACLSRILGRFVNARMRVFARIFVKDSGRQHAAVGQARAG